MTVSNDKSRSGLTRRDFIAATAAAGAIAVAGRAGFALGQDAALKVGFISPRTGPLGGFGQTDGYVLDLARKALAGGFQAGGKTYSVEIIDQDTQSDPSRAGQLAKDLINNQGIDLMLAVSTPETINPVADACEAAGVPCLSTVMPWEAWYFGRGAKPGEPSPFKWTYHFGFGVETFHQTYISQWSKIETNKKVGVMYPNDADGNAIRANLAPLLAKDGYTIVDPGAYETGTTDFSSQIALFKAEGVEIFNSFPIPPDFAAFWRQAAQQGLTKQIKIAQVAKTGLFPSDIEALGDLGKNIASAAYWHKAFPYKSTLTGVGGQDLADGYEAAEGKQWTQQLGASLSLLDAGFEALKAASDAKDKAAVAKAISTLNVTTVAGKVDFTSGPVPNVANGPIIGTQWVPSKGGKWKFDYVVTENVTDPNVQPEATLVPYNS
ncbi:MAG: ABC transporter substrate-binding protein [Devosia nanyangense]|uniref:ABC transporter substrate-binding protein n=1 Tax=Devosia nanyangense TaxID=1228055 RepID=A0A933L374_9HYPH|nr:ABC transporter substrate-binding protein [Devosia nanyangense]